MKTTPENIIKLEHNQVFVFGSNTAGVHGKGAARTAQQLFGARKGVAEGPTGQCYAIPTRIYIGRDDEHWKVRFAPVSLPVMRRSVLKFLEYADQHLDLEFLVTKMGCGYAGYTAKEIAPLFDRSVFGLALPPNVTLPAEFQ